MMIDTTLQNGIRVIGEKLETYRSATVGIWVKAGSVTETPEQNGMSHFIEHMMFKGTARRSARQIAEDIDRIGGQINAFTGKEATCYYVKAVSSSYKKAADVIIDMLTSSLLDRQEMNKERQVICEEIKMTLDSPDDLAHDTITSLIFKGNPLGKSIIGTPTSLKRITHNVMEKYLREEYTRDNIVISVAGNFDEGDVCEYFDEKLLELKAEKAETECGTITVLNPGSVSIPKGGNPNTYAILEDGIFTIYSLDGEVVKELKL